MALSDSAGIGSALPSQVSQSGKFLTTDGTVATWATVSAGSAITSLTGDVTGTGPGATATTITNAVKSVGTFSASSIANGASIATTVLTLGVADGTNPGLLSTTAQTVAGAKTFTAPVAVSGAIGTASGDQAILGLTSGTAGLAFSHASIPTTVYWTDGSAIVLGTPGGSASFFFRQGGQSGTTIAKINTASLDLTGMGAGGAILIKSPNGTTFTLTVSNAGALVIT